MHIINGNKIAFMPLRQERTVKIEIEESTALPGSEYRRDIARRLRLCVSGFVALMLSLGASLLGAAPEGFSAYADARGALNRTSLSVSLQVGTADRGKAGQLFVAARLPDGRLYARSANGWQAIGSGQIPLFAHATLGTHTFDVLSNMDVSALSGTDVYVGYGVNAADMLARQAYTRVHTIGGGLTGPATAGAYLTFSINVQDHVWPDLSAQTVGRIVDLHEQYRLPVDIYLSDTMLDIYQRSYPDLLQKLTSSRYVGLNYHIRPPKPYYGNYDWLGLTSRSLEQQIATITDYETHVTDLVTGEPTARAGGYAQLLTLPNARPAITAAFQVDQSLLDASATAFRQLGATWTLAHTGGALNLGDSARGLFLRPEHFDLLLFETANVPAATSLDAAFASALAEEGARAPLFIGVKMHDNDFFAQRSAWLTVYVDNNRRPPWDTTRQSALKSAADQAAQWNVYEQALQYAQAQRARIGVANSKGIAQLRQQGTPQVHVSGTMHIESNFSTWPNVDALLAFFQRATAAGKVGTKTSGMKWSIGADINWLNNEPRAGEVIRTLSALGVEWDIHAHNAADRIRNVERIRALGGTPNGVVSGLINTEIDALRTMQTTSSGYQWQPEVLWGLTTSDGHTGTSDDTAAGLWRPQSTSAWRAHDPAGNLIAVGNGGRTLAAAEALANEVAAGSYVQPVYSVTLNVQPKTLTIVGTTDGIAQIEAWAARVGLQAHVVWNSLSGTAAAWKAAGALPSRANP